ncbi:TPA: hypothetical protein I7727_20920, partial [Vibrio vulnificus]|nr:hypothetical protein [Vibrio vulnificus]
YIVTDHAGTPQELCSENGDVVWQGEQALWGHYQQRNAAPNHGFRENAQNDELYCDLRYQGQIEDRESGLYYNVNRYYDADSGQYLSPDPIGFAGGLRPQAYVFNPLEWVDPLGLAPSTCKKPGGYEVLDVDDHGNLSPGVNRAPGNLNKATDNRIQSHHPIQQEWAKRNVPGYKSKDAPAILLPSSSGSSHAQISSMQRTFRRQNGYNTSIRTEFNEAARQMREAGVPEESVRKTMKQNYKYFSELGAF